MALTKLLFTAALLLQLVCGVQNSYGVSQSLHISLAHDELFPALEDGASASLTLPHRPAGRYAFRGSSISTPRQLRRRICRHTSNPLVCRRELSRMGIPFFASPLDVVRFSVQGAANRVDEALHLASNGAGQRGLSKLEEQCASDCVELLSDVKEQMAMASSRLSQLHQKASVSFLRDQLVDVKVWLSASLSYQSACSDNFEVAPGVLQRQVRSNQAYLTQVVGVSLSLVDILSRLGNDAARWGARQLNPSPTSPIDPSASRRARSQPHHLPFSVVNLGSDVVSDAIEVSSFLPRWVSTAQRELFQASLSAISADAVVAKDGSGQYTTVTAAVNAIPTSRSRRYVIYIKKGTYDEVFNVTKDQKNVTFVGDGIGKTIITGDRNVASGDYTTYRSSTVGVSASGFYARDITIRNTAGASGNQAVALRAGADYMVFYRCSFEGYQDTLYALSSRQFYRECEIAGTVDFIFGNAIAVFQSCILLARLPIQGQQNTYTAQGRQLAADVSGYSFQNCTVKADATLQNASYSVATFLGRPWKAYSRTVFIQSELQAVVDPAGWLPWNSSNPFLDTLYYGEYGNTGSGSGITKRVTWEGVHSNMTTSEASQFTVTDFVAGEEWISAVDVPYKATL